MNRHAISTSIKTLYSKLPLKVWILIGIGVAIILNYSLIFFIPKSITFSYAQASCAKQLVIAPDLQKTNSTEFDVAYKDTLRIGDITLLATKLCIEPKETPKAGTYTARIVPFGGPVASKSLSITVPEAPVARSADIIGKQISTTEPLKIKLTTPDVIHDYSLEVAEKTATCEQSAAELSCDVAALKLEQGAEYTLSLHRGFKQVDKKLVEGKVATLTPLVMTGANITNDQTLYDKPTSFSLTFDKPVEKGTISLVKVVGETTEKVAITQEVEGTTLKLNFSDLAREATYRLDVTQAIADNGSSLAAPVAISFKTSGGPKTTGVSIGAHSVNRAATIIVTLDQPIDASVDLAKFARVEGVAATVKRQSDTQLAFAIQGGDCAAFNVIIDKGIKSGSNGELSKEAWKFSSRTICGTSWSIGSSVKGRPILAHSFGTGSKTILFTAGIHGSEPSSTTTMQAWVQHLQAYGDIVPADKRVVIVPNTNPDGIAAGSRNNSRNVNLGRNFPTSNWQAEIQTASGPLPTGGGTSAGSEPEAAALISLTRQLRPRAEISFHAQGRLVGANKFGDSVAIGDIYASTVGYKTMYYNAEAVMGYPMTGEYEDWMGEEMGIPAILIELPAQSGNYFTAQLPALKKMLAL